MTVQLPGHAYGVATLADLHDTWAPDALAGLQVPLLLGFGFHARVCNMSSN